MTAQNEKLINDNLALVHSCANRFKGRGVEYDDLFQAGCVGLVKAARGFEPERGFCFSTYAVPAILGEIKRIFRDGGAVKVSRSLKERALYVRKVKDELALETGAEPTVTDIAEKIGLSNAETAELLLVTVPPVSLTVFDNECENESSQIAVPVTGEEEKCDESLTLAGCLESLCERDRRLVQLRYFEGKTQTVTARALGMTQVQVSRREKAILALLREKMTL